MNGILRLQTNQRKTLFLFVLRIEIKNAKRLERDIKTKTEKKKAREVCRQCKKDMKQVGTNPDENHEVEKKTG